MTDPTQFYTGLVAELYSALRSHDPDPTTYARFIAMAGEPALELGCGDGDPLLDLVGSGLDVEGLDSSSDMLDRCRRRAVDRGLDVCLHHAAIEDMALERRYRSIFLANATFNLIPDDATALDALRRIAVHLAPGGMALIPLFIPVDDERSAGAVQEQTSSGGVVMRCTTVAVRRDDEKRTQQTWLRYELDSPTGATVLEREWLLHWHSQDGFSRLVADAGLDVRAVLRADGSPSQPDDAGFTFLLTGPDV